LNLEREESKSLKKKTRREKTLDGHNCLAKKNIFDINKFDFKRMA
jgi:hypothetical protein